MQYKIIKICFYFTMLFILFSTNSATFAGDNIPSDKEVIYAQQVYQEIKIFDANENKFFQQISNVQYTESTKIKNLFIGKFNYTKNYYLKIEALAPTQKFMPIKTTLLNAIYANLEYLQGVIEDLNKGKNIKEVNSKMATKIKEVASNYEMAINKFISVVKSWQTNYIAKVMPVTKKMNSEQNSLEK